MAEPLYVYVCPECGEQIFDSTHDFERGRYWGHYHDPPELWPDGEDPWFDAEQIEVVPLQRNEQT